MNLSMKWLNDYVDIKMPPREFAEAMTMSGSKVEGFEIEGSEISNVVIGKILSVEPHPDADKLVVCMLDVAKEEPIQIVTGATNVFPGAIVPVALDGSTLPNGIKIKKGKLRGVLSNGMLCSLAELNLTVNDFPYAIEDGIFIIEEDCQIGQDAKEALGLNDTCVEFEITSNRPDCLSVIGLAREAAATFNKPLTMKEPTVKSCGDDIHNYLSVEVLNSTLCQRYTAKVVKNVKIEPSPLWLRERLRASGVRPINNIVDITNYVMLEYGHPMHAFDLKYVKDHKIIVRNANENEAITTLDGVVRKLSPEMLVIADSEQPAAVAGVMGGEYSGIMDDTTTIVFEAACFKGSSVRTTAKKIGLRTESSGRFEKGLDPATTVPAILRACELINILNAGDVVDGMIDVDHSNHEPKVIPLEVEWINKFLGLNVSKDEMIRILTTLSFKVENDQIIVPSFRSDIEHKADIAEEIARIYGYNNIPTTKLRGHAEGKLNNIQKFEKTITETLLSSGLYEVMTYSFISPKYYDKILLDASSKLRDSLVISNPLGEDTSIMRTTTIPSILEVLSKNFNNRNLEVGCFEIAKKYIKTTENELPNELNTVTMGMYGNGCDFFALKGIIEKLLLTIGLTDYDVVKKTDHPSFHPGRCAVLSINGEEIGILGEAHPQVLENYGINTRAYIAELAMDVLYKYSNNEKQYKPLPKFPASTRDIAVLCDDELPVLDMERAVKKAVGTILEDIKLFDIYKGSQIAEGKKSVAYSLVLRAKDRTLTDEEADNAMKKALKALEAMGATLRS